MNQSELKDIYRQYIDCLNQQDWANLGRFVQDDVSYNGKPVGLTEYNALLENDFRQIPDLAFNIQMLVCEPPTIAVRLNFNCSPRGQFFGLAINGKTVSFSENVFYTFQNGKIAQVWSVIDRMDIEAQLQMPD